MPRHPQRFEAVRALLARRSAPVPLRSAGASPAATDPVFLVDTLGELQLFYAAADVAFVGGSLVPVGGHNLLEPLANCGALRIVRSREELAERVVRWFDDPPQGRADGAAGLRAVAQSRGAVDRLVAMIDPLLSRPGA